jgi:hypothetical protein
MHASTSLGPTPNLLRSLWPNHPISHQLLVHRYLLWTPVAAIRAAGAVRVNRRHPAPLVVAGAIGIVVYRNDISDATGPASAYQIVIGGVARPVTRSASYARLSRDMTGRYCRKIVGKTIVIRATAVGTIVIPAPGSVGPRHRVVVIGITRNPRLLLGVGLGIYLTVHHCVMGNIVVSAIGQLEPFTRTMLGGVVYDAGADRPLLTAGGIAATLLDSTANPATWAVKIVHHYLLAAVAPATGSHDIDHYLVVVLMHHHILVIAHTPELTAIDAPASRVGESKHVVGTGVRIDKVDRAVLRVAVGFAADVATAGYVDAWVGRVQQSIATGLYVHVAAIQGSLHRARIVGYAVPMHRDVVSTVSVGTRRERNRTVERNRCWDAGGPGRGRGSRSCGGNWSGRWIDHGKTDAHGFSRPSRRVGARIGRGCERIQAHV